MGLFILSYQKTAQLAIFLLAFIILSLVVFSFFSSSSPFYHAFFVYAILCPFFLLSFYIIPMTFISSYRVRPKLASEGGLCPSVVPLKRDEGGAKF